MKSHQTKAAVVLAVAALFAAGAALAQSGDDLLKTKGCLGCHDMEKKKVGPALKDVAAKYKADKGAEGKLVAALKEGPKDGKGHPMKSTASDADLKTMVQFVLSRK
jgi:cytochrome c